MWVVCLHWAVLLEEYLIFGVNCKVIAFWVGMCTTAVPFFSSRSCTPRGASGYIYIIYISLVVCLDSSMMNTYVSSCCVVATFFQEIFRGGANYRPRIFFDFIYWRCHRRLNKAAAVAGVRHAWCVFVFYACAFAYSESRVNVRAYRFKIQRLREPEIRVRLHQRRKARFIFILWCSCVSVGLCKRTPSVLPGSIYYLCTRSMR